MMGSRVWKFQLPIPISFLNNPSIRDEIQRIVDGKGNLPVCLAADMNDEGWGDVCFLTPSF